MICQRSGWCCIGLEVVIIQEDKDGVLGWYAKPTGTRCPHLSFEGDTASCAVHEKPWYGLTPCFVYQNPDLDPDFAPKRGRPCMLGPYVKQRKSLPVYGEPPPKELRFLGRAEHEFEEFQPKEHTTG